MTQTTYPAAQQPQEPKKKRGVLKWILIIVGAIIALLIIAAVFGGGEDTAAQPTAGGSQAPSDKPTSDASKAVPTYKAGEKMTDGGYQAGGSRAPSDKPTSDASKATSDASKATSDASKAVPTYKAGEKMTDGGYQAGGSRAPSDKPTSDASKATSDGSKAVPTYKVGEKVTDDGYQFAVTSVSCGVRRVGDQSMGEDAAGQFCLVNLRVKNVSKDPMNFSSENQALVDSKGRTYSPDDEAWPYVEENVDVTREIDPGNALKTTVPFDVPKKAKPDYLLLKAGVFGFSEGVRVKL